MGLRHFLSWKFEYVFVAPEQWRREHEKHLVLTKYDLLSVWDATTVLRQLAHRDPKFLAELARAVLVMPVRPGLEPMLQELIRALGRPNSRAEEPPNFASFYVARRKRERAFRELPDPWKKVREAIEAAEQAPRGFVVVEVVDEDERPVSGIRLELLLADGQFRTLTTSTDGTARLDPIPQGQCHIRLPQLDGSSWRPAEGPASTRVDAGRKRMHVMRRGDNLTRVAKMYGIKGWKKLWDTPDNDKLRKRRKSPHVLYPGDEVVIPGIQVHQISRPTDQAHRLVVTEEPLEFRVVLQDHNQLPYKKQSYELRLTADPNEKPRTGTTDDKGKIVEPLPPATKRVEVFLLKPKLRWVFMLEELLPIPIERSPQDKSDPATSKKAIEAMQMHLLGLGFPCGPIDGELGPRTLAAIALWREKSSASGSPHDKDPGSKDEVDQVLLADVSKKYEVIA